MFVVKRKEYEKLLDELNLSIEMREKSIDVYHNAKWGRTFFGIILLTAK